MEAETKEQRHTRIEAVIQRTTHTIEHETEEDRERRWEELRNLNQNRRQKRKKARSMMKESSRKNRKRNRRRKRKMWRIKKEGSWKICKRNRRRKRKRPEEWWKAAESTNNVVHVLHMNNLTFNEAEGDKHVCEEINVEFYFCGAKNLF